jgi:hypothetical protein
MLHRVDSREPDILNVSQTFCSTGQVHTRFLHISLPALAGIPICHQLQLVEYQDQARIRSVEPPAAKRRVVQRSGDWNPLAIQDHRLKTVATKEAG